MLIADVALDPYTYGRWNSHKWKVDNDSTPNSLAEMSLNLAKSGADILAPSDMMDGRIGVIRESLERRPLRYNFVSYSKVCQIFMALSEMQWLKAKEGYI